LAVFFCFIDDLGFHNVGWRNGEMSTPHIDALAADGIKLDRHYTFVYCSPSVSEIASP
jgi:arylsulfatase A-like enzyme